MKKAIAFVCLITLALLLSACAGTTLNKSWKAPDADLKPVKSLMVVGLAAEHGARVAFEREFSSDLKKRGVKAVASYKVMGKTKITVDKVKAKAKEHGISMVMTTHVVYSGVKDYTSGGSAPPKSAYDFGAYVPFAGTTTRPVYYQEKVTVALRTNLYRLTDDKLIWSVETTSTNPKNTRELADQLSDLVVDRMRGDGLVK